MRKLERGAAWPGVARGACLAAGLALALALGGCGSLRLHSEVRQKQGEDAAKAWKEVDLKPLFEAERANQARLLEAELNGWNKHYADVYEGEVRRLARTPLAGYGARYQVALERLAGPSAGPGSPSPAKKIVDDALAALNEEQAAARRLERRQSFLQSSRVPRFTCAQLVAPDPQIVDAWKAGNDALARTPLVVNGLEAAKSECIRIDAAQRRYVEALDGFAGGDLKLRVKAWRDAQVALTRRQAQVDAAVVQVNLAQAEVDADAKAAAGGASAADKAKNSAKRLASALDALESVQGALGAEIASGERIKRIDDLLASLASGEPLATEDASKLAIAVSMFPRIRDDLEAVRNAGKGGAAVPLLMQRDIEQAKLNAARVEVARQKQRLELLAIRAQASVRQASSVLRAIGHVQRVTAAGAKLASDAAAAAAAEQGAERAKRDAALLEGLWPQLHPDDRRQVLESTVHYLDAVGRQEVAIEALATRELAISSERSVDLAEVNASLWVALIDGTVGQAAEFSAMGIKASDIEKLLNLIALGYIGRGTNK